MDEADPEDYPIWGYGVWNEFRDPLAEFVGCTRDEIAMLRNSTEANSYIANGLDLKPGDEVLMTDQEHPGGEEPCQLQAKRHGIVVKKVTLPRPVPNAAAVLNLFNDAITPRTRRDFLQPHYNVTGVVLPVKEIVRAGADEGDFRAVDGAHVTGMMQLNVHELGCDMYSSSPHKWLQAPKGTGFLYVRKEVRIALWNTIVTGRMGRAGDCARNDSSGSAARTCRHCGACARRLQFSKQIGMERIEKRHRRVGRLHSGGDGEARRRVVDIARYGAALRDCDGECAAGTDGWSWSNGCGTNQENSDSRRRAIEAAAVDAVLPEARGYRPFPREI